MRYLAPVGRLLYSLIFMGTLATHFTAGAIGYATQAGLPMANVLVPLSGVIAAAGGLSVLLGFHAKLGAWLLVLFLVPVTFTMHAFWAVQDPMMRQFQIAMFMKNIALLGTALLITQVGAGPVSLDERRGAV